ncbi:MAG: DUF5686 family protein [Bacteroidia bacterium]|nr:DUF5686 family protein [Bacteroidia bacterium]
MIIIRVLRHLQEHNPFFFDSYSAITYDRFRIKINLLPKTEELLTDTTKSVINQNNSSYIFSSETLFSQKLLKPGFNQAEILSSKTEGKDNGSFAEMDSSLRDFSLLKPITNFLNKSYLSPFSNNAIRDYCYFLSDTIKASGDSLYLITFHPQVGKRFDGFCGTAIINTKNFAVQHISAQSTHYDQQDPLLIINQSFEQLKGFWLPSERKVTVFFNSKSTNNQKQPGVKVDNLIAESTTNIYQQEINPPLSPADFKNSFSQLKTDSATIAEYQNQQTKMIRFFAEGKIPLGYFTLDYNRIFGYNLFEGLKLGVGGETNRLLSKPLTVGGYISYGLKDQSLRHSEWINFYPSSSKDLRIFLGYRDMNIELGEPEFLETKSLLNPESYRYLLIKNMYASKRYATGLEGRPFNDLSYYVFGDLSENHSRQNTQFLIEHPFSPISLTRTGLQLRYTPGIILQMEDGRHKEMNVAKSDYYLTIIQGLTVLGGEYQYIKSEFKGRFNLPFSRLGITTIVVRGGTMSQNAPIIELFNSYGSFAGTFSLVAPYSFATMKLNEFAAANYTAIHLRHDFSTWLFPGTMQKRPAFIFAQNIGIGQLDVKYLTLFNFKDYRRGFYESGFEINNLLRMNYLSWGVGIYYRYGPYQFSSIHENFAYKFGFFFKL